MLSYIVQTYGKKNLNCRRVYPKVSGLSHDEINNNDKTLAEKQPKVMAAELTILTHKIAIQLHLVVESGTICSSRSRRCHICIFALYVSFLLWA
jgi:hypothetical protein